MAVRNPAVAGTFYPSDVSKLKKFCDSNLFSDQTARSAKAVLLPHAGYMFSGSTACKALESIRVPDTVFLIGPNHWGIGVSFAVAAEGFWQTPLGDVPVDEGLARKLLHASPHLKEDHRAHSREHSLEVEIPLLQTKNSRLRIVPLLVGTLNLAKAKEVALAYGQFLSQLGKEFLLVVSSDMNHYENDSRTREKDRFALDAIERLDPDLLAEAVQSHHISMCGFIPAYMLLVMKDFLKIKKATLADYRTSADASGDYDRVVGYAGFVFE